MTEDLDWRTLAELPEDLDSYQILPYRHAEILQRLDKIIALLSTNEERE